MTANSSYRAHISGVGIDGELASQNRKVVLLDKAAFAAMGLV